MGNLVVCCDGTWNTPDQPSPTNVRRFFNAVAEPPEKKYYHPGVGTDGGIIERFLGGAKGTGIGAHILGAYRWLCDTYVKGDNIYLIGFSRGAFVVRSLAGFIAKCSLLDLSGLSEEEEKWRRIEIAYREGYRYKQKTESWGGNWAIFPQATIHFLGVWDTVGALGIPDDLGFLNLFDNPDEYRFHDTVLSPCVKNARHAVSLDEIRSSFTPTLWTRNGQDTEEQVWFPGTHSNVGGGLPDTGLSDIALKWMIDQAGACGLRFNSNMVAQIQPNPQGVLHDSCTGPFKLLRSQPRAVPQLDAKRVHPSVLERQARPPISQSPYRAVHPLPATLPIFAAERWNYTGVYLEKGTRYRFTAQGQWLDAGIQCTPKGPLEGTFQTGELAQMLGSLIGKVEELYNKITQNNAADFQLTRREEKYPWFSLIGVIASGEAQTDGTPTPHETFMIGESREYVPHNSGYLYCFANDAWNLYENNKGSVSLRVEEIAPPPPDAATVPDKRKVLAKKN